MSERSKEAEELFAEYLARRQASEVESFDALVSKNPSVEAELRRLYERDLEVEAVLPSMLGTGSLLLIPGSVVGDFRLLALIGQGGMGQVWAAEQLSLGGRKVALKFVKPERVTARGLEVFQREARAGGRLQHPGIIGVHAYGETLGLAWIAMELVEGALTLRDFIDERASGDQLATDHDRDAARLVIRVADAMQAVHDAGVIHRDLKPRNILIGPDGRPRVSDLGLARITDESALSETGEFAGTYFYTSPEQVAARSGGVDHRADIFSLGVVLYEMLGLQRPFLGDTSHQVASQILEKEPPDLRSLRSRIPADLVVITGKALEKDRDRRYPTMAELAADLRRFLAEESILARPPGLARRAGKWCRRHTTLSASGTVAVLALVAISGLSLGLARKSVEASTHADEAQQIAEEEQRRKDEVLRLSAWQEYEDLMAEVDQLWPAHPQKIDQLETWVERAQGLVDQLPLHEASQSELRASARPRTEEERAAQLQRHPAFAELETLRSRIEAKRAALQTRRDGMALALPEVDWATYPADAESLDAIARGLLRAEREGEALQALALVLTRRAHEIARDEELTPLLRTQTTYTMARTCYAVGLDEEAREAIRLTRELMPAQHADSFESALEELSEQIESAAGEAGIRVAEEELAALEAEHARLYAAMDERTEWRFGGDASALSWWDSRLSELIAALEGLQDERTGLLIEGAVHPDHGASIPARLSTARRLQDGFANGEHGQRWERDLPEILAAYPGLELGAQVGLVPLGPDPDSGLWEFWHVASGDEPERDERSRLRLTESSGLVFVLVPRGEFLMGAQAADADGPNYDPGAQADESPPHRVVLSRFFLSKYEMTQEQWLRTQGTNPSAFFDGRVSQLDVTEGSCHPVEKVTWVDCHVALPRLGCALPTEAQWEYACRAGTQTPYPFADGEMPRHANLADQSLRRFRPNAPSFEEWDDGQWEHAPVGSFLANAFGLHDMQGNVAEWCSDGYQPLYYDVGPRVDPEAPVGDSPFRILRGASFYKDASRARSSARRYSYPQNPLADRGVRPTWVLVD